MRKMLIAMACGALTFLVATFMVKGLNWCAEAYKKGVRENEERNAKIRSMGPNALRVYGLSGTFDYEPEYNSGYAISGKEIVLCGETCKEHKAYVLIPTPENVTVETEADNTYFATITLTGAVTYDNDGEPMRADGAIIRVPANDQSFLKDISKELFELQWKAKKREAWEKLQEQLNKK